VAVHQQQTSIIDAVAQQQRAQKHKISARHRQGTFRELRVTQSSTSRRSSAVHCVGHQILVFAHETYFDRPPFEGPNYGKFSVPEHKLSLNNSLVPDLPSYSGTRVVPENLESEDDLYFFGCGHDHTSCISDFLLRCGMPPLRPRYAFGTWWSRFLHTAVLNISTLEGNFRRVESLWQFSV
jgi:alpha-glucosidase (family GH31 glycosyl hydrolase)